MAHVAGKSERGKKGSWEQRIDTGVQVSWAGSQVEIRKTSLEPHRDHLKYVVIVSIKERLGWGHYVHNHTVPRRGKECQGGLFESMVSILGIATFCWNHEKSLEWGQRMAEEGSSSTSRHVGHWQLQLLESLWDYWSGHFVLGLLLPRADWNRHEPKLPCRGSSFWPFLAYSP